ncbi:MAG: 3-hydroxybutyrate dehydrogenase [Vulcanimicrobiota bacterium]
MLKGKTALVTGSTSGIGLGIARALAGAGANLMLHGLGDPAANHELADKLADEFAIRTALSDADVTNPAAIAQLVEECRAQLGPVEVLVNNAGIQHVAPVEEFPVAKWDQILAINLSAAFHTIRLTVPAMKQAGWGRIINLASAHSLVASPFKTAYVAAKHGLLGLTKTVALELAQHGITVNAICPGYVLTPLVEKQIPDTAKARGISEEEVQRDVLLAAQPTKQFVTVEQIGELAVFLCGSGAAQMTGTALSMDGGWTAQ